MSCPDEGNTIDIIFEDGTKTKLVNWKKFNCKKTTYFPFNNLFKTRMLKAIRYTDKKEYKTLVIKKNMTESDKSYFIRLFSELDKINNKKLKVRIKKT